MNDLIEYKSWFARNWKWLLPLFMFFMLGIYTISTTKVGEGITTVAKAYNDASLYENALEKVKKNKDVVQLFGTIEPIDNFAILEGTTRYSNNDNSIISSIRIKGSKSKGKLDITAYKNEGVWVYKKIGVRIKKPRQVIIVFEEKINEFIIED
ncbi:cytochrome c oxidase assembly factor Coa1 family protein [uncultured Algibacter sp.]|uniref:cytochrome c oxidase assembly factor Coa1 family protein n=1 Tax=uncultured Algibacter sp. TaxID=298659 RepID=UPI002605A358|nr:cytochrome c oxidase assembly factor Coa1 family protein [uncultured Algibacter sp.]